MKILFISLFLVISLYAGKTKITISFDGTVAKVDVNGFRQQYFYTEKNSSIYELLLKSMNASVKIKEIKSKDLFGKRFKNDNKLRKKISEILLTYDN